MTQLAPVTVTGRPDQETATGPVYGYVATRSATGTKTDTPLNEIPQSISVITTDQITDQGSLRVSDALRYTAGVRHQEYGFGNRGDLFTLRGGSSGSTLLDGLRLPQGDNYGYTRNVPYAYERIEVLRGPAALMAGQGGPGGVVNLVSKRPLPEEYREVGVQIGNYSHKQIRADLTGPANAERTLFYRLIAVGMDSGTQVHHADESRVFVAPSLSWKPNAGTTFTAYAQYQKDKTNNVEAYLPPIGILYDAPHGRVPPSLNINEPSWDRFDGTRKRVGWELEHQLNDQWTVRHHFRHDNNGPGEYYSMYAVWVDGFVNSNGVRDPNGTYMNRRWFAKTEKRRDTNADFLLEGRFRTGYLQHTTLFGADGLWSRSLNGGGFGDGTPLDVYNPVYGSFPEPTLTMPDVTIRMRNIGFVIQDQIKIDNRWVVLAGLRRDRAITLSNGEEQKNTATSKNLGIVWLADGGWSPYLSYTESFEPTLGYGVKADGSSLSPKRGKQIEAGVKWTSADQRISTTAAVYQLKEKNRPAADAENPGYFAEFGEVTVKGVELELRANLSQWDIIAQYTFTDAQITAKATERQAGQQLRGEPKNTAALWTVHKFGHLGIPGLRAGLGVRYMGSIGIGVSDGLTVPSVTLLDALIGYDVGNWRFALNVNNLADKTYVNSCQDAGAMPRCWYGSQRSAIASMTYRW